MFKKAEIIVEIIKLIKSKQFPFTFDQIYEELISYFSGVPKDVYYSARLYKVGQKVFHPSAEVNQWFTVLSIEDEKILVVRLESGDIKKFPQLSNKPKIYIDGVPKDLADIKPMISNVLGLFKHLKNYFGYYISLEEDEYLPLEKVSTSEALKRYFEHLEESSLLSGETISDFESVCNHLGLTSLYYVAPKDNIESILTYGVMARNLAPASHTSFANEDIQDDRHLKIPNPAIPFTLHEYVPLFYSPRPPLLYRFQNKPYEE